LKAAVPRGGESGGSGSDIVGDEGKSGGGWLSTAARSGGGATLLARVVNAAAIKLATVGYNLGRGQVLVERR
jgi:hypothetical protein